MENNPAATSTTGVEHKITVIGMEGGWKRRLSDEALSYIRRADLLVGGKRQLSQFSEFNGLKLAITNNIDEVIGQLRQTRDAGQRAVVLASGDPLCFGIGSTLRRYFSAETLHIIPALSSIQLAFAALGEPWQDAKLVTAHGRDPRRALIAILTHEKSAVLTDKQHTPAYLAYRLLDMGASADTRCAICENLGAGDERVVRTTLAEIKDRKFAALNVFVVWNDAVMLPQSPSLSDSAFKTEREQITKREIRVAVLGEIGLQANEVMWDVGAGSGSVGIEAARSQPTAFVCAFEKSDVMFEHAIANAVEHGVFDINWCVWDAAAPEAFDEVPLPFVLPQPDVVFIGGSGGNLRGIIVEVQNRLPVGGRLVATFATFENLMLVREMLPDTVAYQLQVNRILPIGRVQRLAALNPVFVLKWIKRKGSKAQRLEEYRIAPRGQGAKGPSE